MNNTLTASDIERIASHSGPFGAAYVFKGCSAFDLHLKLVDLVAEFEQRFTEAEKGASILIVTFQQLSGPRKLIKLYFYCKEHMIPSRRAYSKAKRWIALLDAEPDNLASQIPI